VKITVEIDVKPREGQTQVEADAEMERLVSAYLTNAEYPFLADYGPDAWGGWDGPFALAVRVS
jgi:hypothetical protein